MREFLTSKETLVTAGLLIVSAVFFVSALGLPAGTFDPLGPGAAPEMVAGLLCLLCSVILARGCYRAIRGHQVQEEEALDIIKRAGKAEPLTLAGFVVLLLAYLVAFEFEAGHFIVLTIPFLFFSILLLGGLSLRIGLMAIVISLVLSFGLFLLFTRFFVINLPGI